MDVTKFLSDLGLEKYIDVFADNDIDFDILPELSEGDLDKLGLSLGHQKKLLRAIRELGAKDAPSTEISAEEERRDVERRRMTVMFCDLVGSTELAASLDPEDMSEVMDSYRNCCGQVIGGWDGYVASYLGDGAVIYFGYPQAHEDDAERAVRAGLELVNAVGQLTVKGGGNLSARVGIATGLSMVGEIFSKGVDSEHTVVGATPNLAARLQTVASPGSVVIADSTRRLMGDVFKLRDLGLLDLKGFADPMQAWLVLDELPTQSRFEAARGSLSTPLTGRGQEIDTLLECWHEAKLGTGQVVMLSGEAGIGKSRIVQALRERIESDRYTRLHYQCSPYHENSALYPVITQMEFIAGLQPSDPPDAKRRKLHELIGEAAAKDEHTVSLVAELLSIPSEGHYADLNLTPKAQKDQTLRALIDLFLTLADDKPVLAVMEDVHWIDPSTQELLALTVAAMKNAPVLLVVTSRPGYQPPDMGDTAVTSISLNRLGRGQSTTIVEQLTAGKSLPAEVVQEIVEKTDGVPLFVEELTKTMLETGLLVDKGDKYELAGDLSSLMVPETLHDSLMARLDNLAPVKGLAQIASVIGREFSGELLAQVSRLPVPQLQDALEQLISAGLILPIGSGKEANFGFKHALVRDTAYDSLLRSKREELHNRIATTLQTKFPERVDIQPELMAHHLSEARETQRAISFWYKAGERAMDHSANLEAIGHLKAGLKLIEELPEDPQRSREELRFQITLGRAALATKGYAAPEVERAYGRARELCQSGEDVPQLHQVLMGLEAYYFARAEIETAHELAMQSQTIAKQSNDPVRLLTSHNALGITLFHMGKLEQALPQLDEAKLIYDDKHRELPKLSRRIQNPGVGCRSYASLTLWHLGYPERASKMCDEALEMARNSSQPFSTAYALSFATWLAHYRRQVNQVRDYAVETIELSTQQKFSFWLAIAKCYLGWADVEVDQSESGMSEINEGIALYVTTGARISQPLWNLLLSEACLATGNYDSAQRVLSDAIGMVELTDERFGEPELHRLMGELQLVKDPALTSEAETCIQKAIGVAKQQHAKMLELRAVISLGRIWRDKGQNVASIRDLVAPVYEWFSEGFEETDLQQARSLLNEVG